MLTQPRYDPLELSRLTSRLLCPLGFVPRKCMAYERIVERLDDHPKTGW
jgi:hypothetical protein